MLDFDYVGRRFLSGDAGAFTFEELYQLFIFITALYVVGKTFEKFGLPAVVGEIITGILLGPELLELAPNAHVHTIMLLGECGLIMLVIEAGLEVDIKLLKVIGTRGVCVAFAGSLVPVSMGFGIATAVGATPKAAFAIGACLAPTSMGIAVNVLKKGGVLNTTIGQLVIASAVLDDIISLVLLGIVAALDDPTPIKLLKPLLVSGGFLFAFGYIAFFVSPKIMPMLMERVPKNMHDYFLLFLVFSLAFAMIPAAHYAGSSHLLGSFLTGLIFCHNHHVHEVWGRQMKRVMQWLLRLFFGGTIAFEVPIKDIWTGPIIGKAFAFFAAIVGKLATCIWAPGFPGNMYDAFKLGAAMSAWGEFAFILATMSVGTHIIDKEQFSSVVMAILMSVIIGPILLAQAIRMSNDNKKETVKGIKQELDDFEVSAGERLRRYFKISMKTSANWGLMFSAENSLTDVKLELLDHRLDYSGKHDETITITFIARDDHVDLNQDGIVEKIEFETRRMQISKAAFDICGNPDAKVSVSEWLPRRICGSEEKREAKSKDKVLYLHPRFPKEDIILDSATPETLSQRFASHIPCLAVVKEDNKVLGFVTKSNMVQGLLHHKMNLSHAKVTDFMTDVNEMLFMSKNSSSQDILQTMRLNNCKHMPLIDDYSGDIITIIDIRDIVLSCTQKNRVFGEGKTESHARTDVGRNSVYWTSRAGTKIKSSGKLDQDCDNHMDHPFHDGHHVVWDSHADETTEMLPKATKDTSDDELPPRLDEFDERV